MAIYSMPGPERDAQGRFLSGAGSRIKHHSWYHMDAKDDIEIMFYPEEDQDPVPLRLVSFNRYRYKCKDFKAIVSEDFFPGIKGTQGAIIISRSRHYPVLIETRKIKAYRRTEMLIGDTCIYRVAFTFNPTYLSVGEDIYIDERR